jgi:hypothetical protein
VFGGKEEITRNFRVLFENVLLLTIIVKVKDSIAMPKLRLFILIIIKIDLKSKLKVD